MTSSPVERVNDRRRLRERRWRKGSQQILYVNTCVLVCVCLWHTVSHLHTTSSTQFCLSSPPPAVPQINNLHSLFPPWSTGVKHFALWTSFLEKREHNSFFFSPHLCFFLFLWLSFASIFPSQNSLQETMNSEHFFREWRVIYNWAAVSSSYLYLLGC